MDAALSVSAVKPATMQRSCLDMALEGERLCKAGDCRTGVQFFEAAVQIGTTELKTLSAIYSQIGNAYFYLQDYGKSLEFHRHDVNLARTIGDRLGEGKAMGNLGNTLKVLGKYDEALKCCQHHLDIARELGDKNSEARALYNLGSVYHAKGKQSGRSSNQDPGEFPAEVHESLLKATEYYEANLAVVRELGDRAAQGRACGNLGNTHYLLGNFSQAIKFHTERLALAREFGDRSAERRAYSNLGNANIFLGDFTTAADLYGKTLQIAMELSDRALEAQACYSLGNTYTLMRDYERAIEYHVRHLRIAQELRDRVGEGRACWSLGNCYGSLGRPEQALLFAGQHLEISKEIGDTTGQSTALVNLLELKERLGIRDDVVKRVNSYREKGDSGSTGADDLGSSQGRAQRRLSMENMEIVKLTPDKLDAANLSRPKALGRGGHKAAAPGATDKVSDRLRGQASSPEGYDEDEFFELLSRFQSRRIDDQRCSSSVLGGAGPGEGRGGAGAGGGGAGAGGHLQEDKENDGLKANSPNADEFLDMVAGIQGARMNDQRASLDTFPGLNNRDDVIGPYVAANRRPRDEDSLDDQFFEMLIRCQDQGNELFIVLRVVDLIARIEDQRSEGARIEDQRSELPPGSSRCAPTVPDEDFMNLIHRFQSNRLEEQRSSLAAAGAGIRQSNLMPLGASSRPSDRDDDDLGATPRKVTPPPTPGVGGAVGGTGARKKSSSSTRQSATPSSVFKPWSSMKRRADKK